LFCLGRREKGKQIHRNWQFNKDIPTSQMNRPLVEVWIERHWPRRQGWRRTLYRKTCKSFLKRALKQLGMEDKEAEQWVKQFERDKTVTEEFKKAIKKSQTSPVPFIDFINEQRASILRIMSEKTNQCQIKVSDIKRGGTSEGYGSEELQELSVSFSGLLIYAKGTLRECELAKRVIQQMPDETKTRPLETGAELRTYPKSHAQARVTIALEEQLNVLRTYAKFLSEDHGPNATEFIAEAEVQTNKLVERTTKSQECIEKEIEELQESLIESLRIADANADADDDDDDDDDDDEDEDDDDDQSQAPESGSPEY